MAGAVEAKPNGTGKPVVCVAGQSILIAGPNENAMCGDLGSFSSAAGSPGHHNRPEPGHNGQDRGDRTPKPDKPDPDPDPDQGGEGSGGSSSTMLFDEEPFVFG
jgi:hypothetical protein